MPSRATAWSSPKRRPSDALSHGWPVQDELCCGPGAVPGPAGCRPADDHPDLRLGDLPDDRIGIHLPDAADPDPDLRARGDGAEHPDRVRRATEPWHGR